MDFAKCLFADTVGDLFMSNPLLPFTLICVLALRLGYRPIAVKEWLRRADVGHGKYELPKHCKLATFLVKGKKSSPRPTRKSSRNKPTPGVRGGVAKAYKAKLYRSVLPRLRCDPYTPTTVERGTSTSTPQSQQHAQGNSPDGANQAANVRCAEVADRKVTEAPALPKVKHLSKKLVIRSLPPSMFSRAWIIRFCEVEGGRVSNISLRNKRHEDEESLAVVEMSTEEHAFELKERRRPYLGTMGATIVLG